jgi:hypothetical protein
MNLFNRKTLKRHIKPAPIPADHLAALDAWADMIRSGRVYALKETALHGQFAAKIIEGVLGYHGPAGGADYTVATEQAILRGSVDLALGRFGGKTPEILAPFELKGADTRDLDAIMPGRNKTPVQQAWEGGFFEATTQNTTKIPIPATTEAQKEALAELAAECQLVAKKRRDIQAALRRRIPDLCPLGRDPKLTTRLQEWWTLPDFAAFRAEVKKVFKADIPLAERSAWEDWSTRDRAEIARLSAEIAKAEAQIDSIVYSLFDLTTDEIALLESVV